MLGVSPFTIRRYIQLRKLKALKLEGSYRVRRSDLRQFLKAREIETEEELAELEVADDESDSARRVVATQATRVPSKPVIKSKKALPHAEREKRSKQARNTTTRKQNEP